MVQIRLTSPIRGGLDLPPDIRSSSTGRGEMQALKIAVRTFCVVPFLTGAADIVDGAGLLALAGAQLGQAANDPVLDSQIGFWGAIWFGFGVILWRASSRLRNEPGLFRLLCGILVLSGLARLGSAMAHGSPGPELAVAMAVEFVGGVGLLLWHASALGRRPATSAAQSCPS
jgi:hypothetical protein